jgi:hypothetical protein
MTELSPAVRALLEQAGAQHDPSQLELERGLDALHTSLAFSAPLVAASVASAAQAAPGATSAAAPIASSAFSGGSVVSAHAVKLYLVAASVIGSIGTVAVWRGAPAPDRAPMVQRAEPVPAPAPVLEPAPVPVEPAPSKPTRTPRVSADIGAELALIEAAQQSLQRAEPQRALEQLAQHARSFPRGVLGSEREGLRAIALCDAGRTATGRAARDTFLERHGSTPIAARVRKACL